MLAFAFLSGVWNLKAQSTVQNNYVQKLDAKDLEGKWFLISTTSKVWEKKGMTQVSYTFTPGEAYLQGLIAWMQHGKEHQKKTINVKTGPRAMKESQDKGMFTKRHQWFVVAMGSNKEWMVVYYGRKLFGHESILVFSKSVLPGEQEKAAVNKLFTENYFLQAKSKKIKDIPAS